MDSDMETGVSRFARLYRRDSSVSLMRVRLARRRSLSQKENRHRAYSQRRGLESALTALPERELSLLEPSAPLDAPLDAPASRERGKGSGQQQPLTQQQQQHKGVSSAAVEERKRMLERYKEAKLLQKERERRQQGQKGVFKVGLYKPEPATYLPPPATHTRAQTRSKAPVASVPTRMTRSMTQQQQQETVKIQSGRTGGPPRSAAKRDAAPPPRTADSVSGTSRAPQTRAAASRTQGVAPPAGRARAAPANPVSSSTRAPQTRAAASRTQAVAPPASRARAAPGNGEMMRKEIRKKDEEQKPTERERMTERPTEGERPTESEMERERPTESEMERERERQMERECVDPSPITSEGGMEAESTAETPASLPALAPSSFAPQDFMFQPPEGLGSFQPNPMSPCSAEAFLNPRFTWSPRVHLHSTDQTEPQQVAPALSPLEQAAPSPLEQATEPQHDVSYFRAVIQGETDRLTGLCIQWDSRTEDPTIPEDIQDLIRTTVGQARLLMSQRFLQFTGLVDDCELGRGEKETTTSDLQGFWDMVYFQVEDVSKKFSSLEQLEQSGWQQLQRAPSRPKKTARKLPPPSQSAAGPGVAGGSRAGARSRLAAVKAAMRARQREGTGCGTEGEPATATAASDTETVVFDAGFFKVESPAKLPGSVRKSLHQSTVPASSPKLSPRRRLLLLPQPTPDIERSPSNPSSLAPPSPSLCPLPPLSPAPTHTHAHSDPISPPLCTEAHCPMVMPTPSAPPSTVSLTPSRAPVSNPSLSPPLPLSPMPNPPLSSPDWVTSDPTETQGQEASLSLAQKECPLSPQQPEADCGSRTPGSPPPSLSPRFLVPSSVSPPLAQVGGLSFSLSPTPSVAPFSLALGEADGHSDPLEAEGLKVTNLAPHCVDRTESPLGPAMLSLPGTPASPQCQGFSALDLRYLQPTVRCSMSPREAVAMEVTSPAMLLGVDVEMESPVLAHQGGQQRSEVHTDSPYTAAVQPRELAALTDSVTPAASPRAEDLLLFTPQQREALRQSLAASDLMMFTPPTSQ
ncbi:disks large-associated protein 5 isoform X2 [Amia ocellicauda]|uniref:disks large-associated protein 5 isoform X2 n=1 Tax=Amia ocellicauda TaxID=2972642 RepID=UPI003463AD81